VLVVNQFETEFERLLEAPRRDAYQAARYGFAEFAIHVLASRSFDIIDRVQEHAGFWNTVLGGLQGSAFIALGRLFDKTKGTVTARKVLTYAMKNPGLFTKDAFKKRRQKTDSNFDAAHYLDFFAAIHEARAESFRQAKEELDKWTKFFEDHVEDIRHMFAHSTGASREEVDRLFESLLLRELEQLVVFPLRLLSALQQLYQNGHEPVLQPMPTHIHEVIAQATDRCGHSAPEHVYVVQEVASFMEWMTKAPSAEADARAARGPI
jgi:hypothetical protein